MQDEITVQELQEKLDKNEGVLIDVREKEEFEEINLSGKLVPLSELEQRFEEIPKDVPVYIHCRSGKRSRTAVEFLKTKGYTNTFNIQGGILAWLEEIDPSGRQA